MGNETLIGQVASIMENLSLSFEQVMDKIPYRMLLLMQKDKLHIATGSVINQTSGRSMAQRKIAKQ